MLANARFLTSSMVHYPCLRMLDSLRANDSLPDVQIRALYVCLPTRANGCRASDIKRLSAMTLNGYPRYSCKEFGLQYIIRLALQHKQNVYYIIYEG